MPQDSISLPRESKFCRDSSGPPYRKQTHGYFSIVFKPLCLTSMFKNILKTFKAEMLKIFKNIQSQTLLKKVHYEIFCELV